MIEFKTQLTRLQRSEMRKLTIEYLVDWCRVCSDKICECQKCVITKRKICVDNCMCKPFDNKQLSAPFCYRQYN